VQVPEAVAHLVALPEYKGPLEMIAKAAAHDGACTLGEYHGMLLDEDGNVLWETGVKCCPAGDRW
jgi:hypothetical protein